MRSKTVGLLTMLAVACAGRAEAGSDRDKFLGTLKKFGLTSSVATSKKPCRCLGGTLDGRIGVVTIAGTGDGGFRADCSLPIFTDTGVNAINGSCLGSGGTGFIDYAK